MIALLGVWLAAIVSPGPDLFQIIRVGAKDRRDGVLCALGIMAGNTIWIVASLAGDVEVEEAAEYLYQNGIPAYAYSTELPVESPSPSKMQPGTI